MNVAGAKGTASTLRVRHLCPSMRASVADITSGHIAIDASKNSIFTRATLMFYLFYARNDESRSRGGDETL